MQYKDFTAHTVLQNLLVILPSQMFYVVGCTVTTSMTCMTEFTAGNKLKRINEPGKLNLPPPEYWISILETTQQA